MAGSRVYEEHDASFGSYFEAVKELERQESAFQDIHVFETELHGRIMMIDGLTMLTEHTHYVYHELMTHVPIACAGQVRSVLVIGGGDGGTVTELVKYPGIERIVLAELDGAVVDMSRRWFPEVAAGLDDPRVEIRIGDGAAYLASQDAAFDVVIIDSTDICDETGDITDVASPLATDAFYADLKKALRPGGVVSQVLGSLVFYQSSLAKLLRRLDGLWPQMRVMRMSTPFYITGEWAAGVYSVDNALEPGAISLPEDQLRYVNDAMARACLTPTNDIKRLLGRD